MALPQLPYNLHDANMVHVRSGPRREVTFTLDVFDGRFYQQRVHIRLSGIQNFTEVEAYLARIPSARSRDAYVAQVDSFGYAPNVHSSAQNLIFELAIEGVGLTEIRCRNLAIRTDEQAEFTLL
jgi:hypothetical protein